MCEQRSIALCAQCAPIRRSPTLPLIHCHCSAFASSIARPFGVRYNAYTERVELLDSAESVERLVSDIWSDVHCAREALVRLARDARERAEGTDPDTSDRDREPHSNGQLH